MTVSVPSPLSVADAGPVRSHAPRSESGVSSSLKRTVLAPCPSNHGSSRFFLSTKVISVSVSLSVLSGLRIGPVVPVSSPSGIVITRGSGTPVRFHFAREGFENPKRMSASWSSRWPNRTVSRKSSPSSTIAGASSDATGSGSLSCTDRFPSHRSPGFVRTTSVPFSL